MPVVSFFDPDDLIKQSGLGLAASNPDDMKSNLELLINDSKRRTEIGLTGYRFVCCNYAPEKVVADYESLFAG